MAEGQSVEELQRLLREAQQRTEEQRQRAEEERQRAEKERQRAEKERQRAEKAERETRPTTLTEYLAACHTLVFSRFSVETDPRFSSKGPITNPRDKWCPTQLQPWSDFLDEQRSIFDTLNSTFPLTRRAFENKSFLAALGDRFANKKVADEKTLEGFLHISVEDPVRIIMGQLKDVPEASRTFNIGNGIIFENHPHAISNLAEEVVERESPSTRPQTPDQGYNIHQLRADQICVYRSDSAQEERRTMIYVCEYKPPHKLTAPHLRLGLRPMNIYKDVVNRRTIPTSVDPAAQFRYHADKLTASAVTQTYHYMIEGGLEYGLLTTGEAIVFLKIDWDDPGTLYYHLTEPGPEALARPNQVHLCTAVAQYLSFTLMAMAGPREHGQEERQRATQNLRTWAVDFETTIRSIPENERTASSDADFIPGPTTYEHVDRSPVMNRLRRRAATRDQCDDRPLNTDGDPGPPWDDESPWTAPETPTPAGPRRSQRVLAQRPRGGGNQKGEGPDDAEVSANTETGVDTVDQRDRQYCSQQCLLGLVKGRELDPACPNVNLHRRKCHPGRHPVDHAGWLALLHDQLQRSLDDGIVPLGHGGARGVLFKVTLLAYGYTFVSKGTVKVFIPDLQHEEAVYERLSPIQGRHVPVFLGAVDLRPMNKIYYYAHRVYVVYMAFLSWAGCSLTEAVAAGVSKDRLGTLAMESLQAVHRQYVVHKDVRRDNMLFSRETDGVMMIDFERAAMIEPRRPPLGPVIPNAIPNKRGRAEESSEAKHKRIRHQDRSWLAEVEELRAVFAFHV
ncbi:hypothetical protein SODALDRAFT_379561 [Sodiomyces alkalinus F11]|uniref:non-specific serine/threonine protein kinase n=1 Tax=Sodiomyces alkalinus (strain CBS 110278 / VKM F-3762 / F11) TaxID=1314773 RepID=A0A3N2PRD7_SODAK|nr:hypothetical protein SODALDRAFT_379561 [Sodiomyces alkalinus F11]ROT37073.1 hypothetical protein SODALDRAFT_379561 [Sodiomyces alkalinus F11]